MGAKKFAVSIDELLVKKLDKAVKNGIVKSRSNALKEALSEYLIKLETEAIKRECLKLNSKEERGMANEFSEDENSWPQY
ncbi:MAG: ribbon-helix-helix protein, CopG family [Bdellovibrionaceae bacterium]|nr:ribbon-helix-helix protein, CopG family [Pseudobdellovibrionaceae bacterium]